MTVASCVKDGDEGSGEERHIYETGTAQCSALNDSTVDCGAAEKKAKEELAKVAPKYPTKEACEAEHGTCESGSAPVTQVANGTSPIDTRVGHDTGNSWFMPAMIGYMVGKNLGDSHPVYLQQDKDDKDKKTVMAPTTNSGGAVVMRPVGSYSSTNSKYVPGTLGDGMAKAAAAKGSTTTSTRAGFGGKAVGSVGG